LWDESTKYPRWVPKWENKEISGYWVSHLIFPRKTALDMVKAYQDNSEEYFYTYVLANPPANPMDKLSRDVILQNCSEENPKLGDVVVAGLDQGKTFHMVIGTMQGIYKLLILPDWQEVYRAMDTYGITTCVCDYLPDTEGSKAFYEKFPGRVLRNLQNEDKKGAQIVWFDNAKGVAYTDRNPLISYVLKLFVERNLTLFMPKNAPMLIGQSSTDYRSYCGQAETLTRLIKMSPSGNMRMVWESKNKQDHFILATCYYEAARHFYREIEEKYSVESVNDKMSNEQERLMSLPDAWMYL
jgi:hypothetical protein